MKEETTEMCGTSGLGLPLGLGVCDLVFSKLKDIGIRATKVKKIKCLLQKQEEPELFPSSSTFGVALEEQQMARTCSGSVIPRFLQQATEFLFPHLTSENIFRKNGLIRRQKDLKETLNRGGTFEGATVDDVASLFKQWFRELPEPIFPFLYHDLFFRCFEICKEKNNHTAVLLACLLLPRSHLTVLKYTLSFLASVVSYSDVNHMDSWNIGVVMAPNFLPSQDIVDKAGKASNKLVQHQAELIQMLIDHASEVGTLPPCHLELPLSAEEDIQEVNVALRRKKRRSMHEVVDCLRKRVVHAPLNAEDTKKTPRSASKRKADNSSLPQPSPCKKRALAHMSLPASVTDSGNCTPVSNALSQINICDSSFASPTPKKGFGLLGRRSKYRKNKCFASAQKRKTNNNNKACESAKFTPDPFLKNNLNDFITHFSSKQQAMPSEQVSDNLFHAAKSVQEKDFCLEIVQEDPCSTEDKNHDGLANSPNSTDSGMNSPIQFVDVDSTARKVGLKRGRPNTTKMGLKSPFIAKSDFESLNVSTASDIISPVLSSNLESKAEALVLDFPQNPATSGLELQQKSLRRSLSVSDSSLRRFLTENILNALNYSVEEFSMGSSSDALSTGDCAKLNSNSHLDTEVQSKSSSSKNVRNPHNSCDLSDLNSAEADVLLSKISFSSDWSHCSSNVENPFSVNTCTSDIGIIQSVDSIDEPDQSNSFSMDTGESKLSPHSPAVSPALALKPEPLSTSIDDEDKHSPEKMMSTMTSSTPIQLQNVWMNEEEFKTLLENVPSEREGTKRESILQLRTMNAGRVRANVEHYDTISVHKDSPYPKAQSAFERNNLVTRSVREQSTRNRDSQGFVVPKGIPTSIKRCPRNTHNQRTANDSPVPRTGSAKTPRRTHRNLGSPKKEQTVTSMVRGVLKFSEDSKENVPIDKTSSMEFC